MLYYVLAIIAYYVVIVCLVSVNSKKGITAFLIGVSPLTILVCLRGEIGTDTLNYLQIVSDIKDSGSSNVEIGFVLIVKFLLHLQLEPAFILVSIALLTTLALGAASSISRRSLLVSMLCTIPVFYLDMTMNGLRYGVSFALVMISVSFLYRNQFITGVILSFTAIAVHASGAMLLFFIAYLFLDKKISFFGLIVILIGVSSLTFMQYYTVPNGGGVNYAVKLLMYADSPSPPLSSGLVPMFLSLILVYVIAAVDTSSAPFRSSRIIRCVFLILAAFILAKFTYAGLRVQLALLFSLLVGLQLKPEFAFPLSRRTTKHITLTLFLVGVIGISSFIKNILSEGDGNDSNSTWLPYTFNLSILRAFN